MILRELFDRPVDYSRNGNEYRFSIGGINYKFNYFLRLSHRAISVQFCELERNSERNCRYDITNSGNHIKVFSTVVSIMREVIEEFRPILIHFTAEEDSRKKLYMRMVKSLVPSWKLYTGGEDGEEMLVFSVLEPRITKEEISRLAISSIEEESIISLKMIPKEFYTYELCLAILRKNLSYFYLIPTPKEKVADVEWPKMYKLLCIELVSDYGSKLGMIPMDYRDYEVCLAAVRDDSSVLERNLIPNSVRSRLIFAIEEEDR